MANVLYPIWKQQLLQFTANNNLSAGNVKVSLIDTGSYTYSAAHQFYSSVPGGAIVATSGNLTGKTFSATAVFDAADVTYTAVTGAQSEALIIWIDTGTAATSPLVAFFDTVTGLPVLPNGGNITITWDASGIFQL